jgi:hypothetical protein
MERKKHVFCAAENEISNVLQGMGRWASLRAIFLALALKWAPLVALMTFFKAQQQCASVNHSANISYRQKQDNLQVD